MLTRFGFRLEMLYLCTSEEEEALNMRVFSSFFGPKNGFFTSEIIFFTLLRKNFFGVCGSFLSNVGGFFTEVERLKVKRYLFSWPHFFTFWVTTQVNSFERLCAAGKKCTAPCLV